jgi:transcriptional regulator GlxA family with amidase domain
MIFLLVLWICFAAAPNKVEQVEHGPKYARAPLSEDQADQIKLKLELIMSQDRAFLDPLLSLQSLASQIGVPTNQLSRFLNERSGLSFFDYVNRARVQHARDLMLRERSSVLDSAFSSGFNSKSTYYKAFQREFGESPATCLRNSRARD